MVKIVANLNGEETVMEGKSFVGVAFTIEDQGEREAMSSDITMLNVSPYDIARGISSLTASLVEDELKERQEQFDEVADPEAKALLMHKTAAAILRSLREFQTQAVMSRVNDMLGIETDDECDGDCECGNHN